MGTLENLFNDLGEVDGPINREHTAFFTVLQLRFPTTAAHLEASLARAWMEVGQLYPVLRAQVTSPPGLRHHRKATVTLTSLSDSEFRNSFSIHRDCPNVDVLFSVPSPRSTTATCHWLPGPGQVVIRTAHWRTDGFGLVLLADAFLSALAKVLGNMLNTPAQDEELKKCPTLPSTLEDLVSVHVPGSEDVLEDSSSLVRIFLDGGKSIGLPTRPGASKAAPTICERAAVRMSSEESEALIRACRTRGISVTSAVNAAVIAVTARFPQDSGADSYVIFAPADMRGPLIKLGARECLQPTGNYVSGIPLRVDGVVGRSDTGGKVTTGKSFDDLACELSEIYSQDVVHFKRPGRPDEKSLNLLQSSEPYIRGVSKLFAMSSSPGCPFPKTPVVSSFGKMDTFIKKEYVISDNEDGLSRLEVCDFWVGCDCATPMMIFNPYTWGGRFTILSAWDDSYYSKEFAQNVLAKVMEELIEGLDLGNAPYRTMSGQWLFTP